MKPTRFQDEMHKHVVSKCISYHRGLFLCMIGLKYERAGSSRNIEGHEIKKESVNILAWEVEGSGVIYLVDFRVLLFHEKLRA